MRRLAWIGAGYGVGLCQLIVCGLLPTAAVQAQSVEQLRMNALPEIQKLEAEKAARTPAQQKISSHLLDALKLQNGQTSPDLPNLQLQPIPQTRKGALVEVKGEVTPSLRRAIQKQGGTIIGYYPEDRVIRARVPLGRLESIAAHPDVTSISPAPTPTTNGTQWDGEGRIAHAADRARAAFKVDGAGVKIGIISDSIDNARGDRGRAYKLGAITRATLTVLDEYDGGWRSGEGLAMAEVIHAIAPKASMLFATGYDGEAAMARAIREMQKRGCKIIVDDVTYPDESPFQDGPIAAAVNDVSDAGVLYFSASRNGGSKRYNTSATWEGDFVDSGIAAETQPGTVSYHYHLFDKGIHVAAVKAGSHAVPTITLFWAEPRGHARADYNLYVLNSEGHVVRPGTTTHDNDLKDPYQFIQGVNAGESIVISKPTDAPSLFMHLEAGDGVIEPSTRGAVRGHNASGAANAFSVGATRVSIPPSEFVSGGSVSAETFSADGPRRMFFKPDGTPLTPGDFSSKGGVVLIKPDLAAADGVTTTLPIAKPGTAAANGPKLNPFTGTSAAAPHAAAIAALLLSYDKTLTPSQVRQALTSAALAIETGATDEISGSGVVMAYQALLAACKIKNKVCPGLAEQATK